MRIAILGCVIMKDGEANDIVIVRIKETIVGFVQFCPVLKAREVATKTKIRLFNSNELSGYMYRLKHGFFLSITNSNCVIELGKSMAGNYRLNKPLLLQGD